MKERPFLNSTLQIAWLLSCLFLAACNAHIESTNQPENISSDSVIVSKPLAKSAPDSVIEELSSAEMPVAGEMICFENTNKDEIEEYLYFEITGDSIHGRYDGYHEEIGYYYNDFFGKITSPGKAEVTILTDIEYDNEEITGNVWEFNSDRLHVLEGDRGTVGPYDYSAIPCAEKKQKVKGLQRN